MRGYFGIGVDGINKPRNLGNLLRSSHSFGASFFFTINTTVDIKEMKVSDTSDAFGHLPFYNFEKASDMVMPDGVAMVAVEFLPDAVDLPSFRHPKSAVYILGPEKGNVSDEVLARCDHVIKIPMKFCINVGVAGALVMYDRLISMGRFEDRPVAPGGPKTFAPLNIKKSQIV